MRLRTYQWQGEGGCWIICVHGLTQDGQVFEDLALRLAPRGYSVLSVDLRGHGESGDEPPWNIDTHIEDLLGTSRAMGIERATWMGHSFGARVVACLARAKPASVDRLILLDPAMEVDPRQAKQRAETERLDWSFATVDGAVNAILSTDSVQVAPRHVVEKFVHRSVLKGVDGRWRFRSCPSAAVVAWSEMTMAPPQIAEVDTLLVRASERASSGARTEARYRDVLGDRLTAVTVPNGHNVLWESPDETATAIEGFLDRT